MMSKTSCVYTLSDFHSIGKSNYNYNIPDDTIKIINILANKVGAPTYVKTPNFKHDRRNKNTSKSNDNWEMCGNFKSTEFKEVKGLDKQINNIKLEINKITNTTYNNQLEIISKQLQDLEISTLDDKNRVGQLIFDVVCSNIFYSKLYAQLIDKLSLKFEWLLSIFHNTLNSYTEKAMQFEINPSSDEYEKFCKVNKDNDSRKALITFYINLMDTKIINVNVIINILEIMNNLLKKHLQNKSDTTIVEQLTENICIILENIYEQQKNNNIVMSTVDYIRNISNSKSSQYPGLSNKTIFRFMDALDIIS